MKKNCAALFYLGHPAHFHLFKNAIRRLPENDFIVCIKSKDVLEKLLQEAGIPYFNVDEKSASRKNKNTFGRMLEFANRLQRLFGLIREYRPRRLMGSAAELGVLGRLTGIPSYIFFEDDFEKVASFARIAGPTATYLICPDVCSAWKWSAKKIGYPSYHELAYLHPNHFRAEDVMPPGVDPYFILRFSELGAYHDTGKSGISDAFAMQLIQRLQPHGKVYITSERKLPPQFEEFRISIPASKIHHALAGAMIFIGDSQTMTAEAAVLGTPALRFNDFVGELGYLEDLEHRFALTYGVRTNNPDELMRRLDELLAMPDLKKKWSEKRMNMLSQKNDFAKSITEILGCEPNDLECIRKIGAKQ